VIGTIGFYDIERKDENGNWPIYDTDEVNEGENQPTSKKEKPKGSWRKRSKPNEEE